MEQSDQESVLQIEHLCHPHPWTWKSFVMGIPSFNRVLENSEQKIVGFICTADLGVDIEIQNLAIHPNHQQKGYASRLLEDTIHQSNLNHKERVLLEVRENNTPAHNLYKKYQFNLDGIRKGYYEKGTIDAYLMSLNLVAK